MRQQIVDILKVLAASADEQVRYLEGLNLPGYTKPAGQDLRNIDELALEFSDANLARETLLQCKELTDVQVQCLFEVDQLLKSMSGISNVKLWTVDALYSRQEWDNIRAAATACLAHFEKRLH